MVRFENTFLFQSLLKDEATSKIHNQLLQFIFLFYFHNQILQFLFLFINFLTNLLLKYLITFLKILLCSFASFLIVSVTPFSKILESSRAWTIFFTSVISSFKFIKAVVPEPFIFFLNFCINCWSSSNCGFNGAKILFWNSCFHYWTC